MYCQGNERFQYKHKIRSSLFRRPTVVFVESPFISAHYLPESYVSCPPIIVSGIAGRIKFAVSHSWVE